MKAYNNLEEVDGLSVMKEVEFKDSDSKFTQEWCAEAYMKTDYSKLSINDFEKVLKRYSIFKTIGFEAGDDENG